MSIEEKISEEEALLGDPEISGDYKKVVEISNEISEMKETLAALYDEYEVLAEEIEKGCNY